MADSVALAVDRVREVVRPAGGGRVARGIGTGLLVVACAAGVPAWGLATVAPPEAADSLALARAAIVAGDPESALPIAHRASARLLSATGDSLAASDALLLELEARWRGSHATEPDTRALARGLIAILERRAAPQDSTLATALLFGSIVERRSGDYDVARGWVERAIDLRTRIFGPEHPLVTQGQVTEANLLIEIGDFGNASALLERAVSSYRHAGAGGELRLANALRSLGSARYRAGDLGAAQKSDEEALAILLRLKGPRQPDRLAILSNLSVILYDMGRFEAARDTLRTALAGASANGDSTSMDVAGMRDNLGRTLLALGDGEAARREAERALSLRMAALPPGHPALAASHVNLARALSELGSHAAALREAGRAVAIDRAAFGDSSLDLATDLETEGRVALEAGQPALAHRLAQEAIAIRRRAPGGPASALAESMRLLCAIELAQGRVDAARASLNQAIDLARGAFAPGHPEVAYYWNDLGLVEFRAGRFADAARDFAVAQETCDRSTGAPDEMRGDILTNLASAQAVLGDTAAFGNALRAEAIGRNFLRHVAHAAGEFDAFAYGRQRARGLDIAASCLLAQPDADRAQRFWDAVVQSRCAILDESARRRRDLLMAGDSSLAPVSEALAGARNTFNYLMVEATADDRAAKLDSIGRAIDRLESELVARSGSEDTRISRSADLPRVRAALPDGTALLAYLRYTPLNAARGAGTARSAASGESEPRYLALVLAGASAAPRVLDLGPASVLEDLLARWYREASTGILRAPARTADQAFRVAGVALRKRLWDPVTPWVAGMRRVVVVPDGDIALVNFATLPSARPGHYLVEQDPTFLEVSSERDLVPDATDRPGRGLLALGAIDFGGCAPPRAAIASAGRCRDFSRVRFPSLGGSEEEITRIARLYREGPVTRLSGREASEQAFAAAAKGCAVIHFATHGFFLDPACATGGGAGARGIGGLDPISAVIASAKPAGAPRRQRPEEVNPLRLSGLALAGANCRDRAGVGDEDGILTADEVAAQDLRGVQWVVLSACETGVGTVRPGEGILGLRRAFRVAGAQTLILSLWSVEDRATRDWMSALYEARFVQHESSADAARTASRTMLAARRSAGHSTHPFFWGGFVASGVDRDAGNAK